MAITIVAILATGHYFRNRRTHGQHIPSKALAVQLETHGVLAVTVLAGFIWGLVATAVVEHSQPTQC